MMNQPNADVIGLVRYRMGDGPLRTVPRGPVEVAVTAQDATLSWLAGETPQSAAVPMVEYQRMLASHALVMRH
ncbi:MAG: hypothetical protein RL223_1179 [Pseudomonadota bacterium]|jgi:hypothetical protein